MDKEYVDRKLVEDSVRSVRGSIPSGDPVINVICNTITEKIMEAIKKIPNEDVEPVEYGRWIPCEKEGLTKGNMECSECGWVSDLSYGNPQNRRTNKRCFNCGAKMDKEATG